jgi:hypothetical protein
MIGRIPRWFLIVGIVTDASGCDNVSFGGMSVSLKPPPGDSLDSEGGDAAGEPSGPEPIAYGPLLYAGTRVGDSASVVPVGEVVEGALRPLPAGARGTQLAGQILQERLTEGSSLTLFDAGQRVGTLIVASASGPTEEFCSPRPQAHGHIELVPSAAGTERFLALETGPGSDVPFGNREPLEPQRAHRIAAQNLGGEALNELRAPWPAALQNIRQDLQVFRLSGNDDPALVATFLFQDQMMVQPAPDGGYSLMILGEPRGNRYQRTYTWFRPVSEEGKGAPRLFGFMDWDGDGEDEILLEVLGSESRWWAGLDRSAGAWDVSFQDPCGLAGQRPDYLASSEGEPQ